MIYVSDVIQKALRYPYPFYDVFNRMKGKQTTREGVKFFNEIHIEKVGDSGYIITDKRYIHKSIHCDEGGLIESIINMANICGCLREFDSEFNKTPSSLTLANL